jgi:hypothetical protein
VLRAPGEREARRGEGSRALERRGRMEAEPRRGGFERRAGFILVPPLPSTSSPRPPVPALPLQISGFANKPPGTLGAGGPG